MMKFWGCAVFLLRSYYHFTNFGPNSKFLYDFHLTLFPSQVGKAEFLGRAIGKPNAILQEEEYKAPSLEWFQIHRGAEEAGELLAAFEMFEVRK